MPRPSQAVQVPGEYSPEIDEQPIDDKDAEIARLRAQLAQANPALPQGVYEPVTPHGREVRQASKFAHLTVAELMAEIDAGRVAEPFVSCMCADGYYARRNG